MKRKMKPLKEVVSVPVFARQKNSAQQDYLNDYFFKEISRLLEIVKKTPSYQALPEDKQSDFCAFFSDLLDINKDILFVDEYAVKLKKEIKPECNPLKNPWVSSDEFPFLVQVKIARYLKGVILTPKKRAVIVGKLSPFCAVEDGKFCEMPFNNLEDTVRLFMILNDLA